MKARSAEAAAEFRRVVRFGLVGVLNTVVDLGVFSALAFLPPRLFGAPGLAYPLAHTISYAAGVLNSFLWNRTWTFRVGTRLSAAEALRFIAVNLASYGLALGFIAVLHDRLGLGLFLAKACSIAVSLAVNYAGSRFFVWRKVWRDRGG